MATEWIDLELPTGEMIEIEIDSSWTDEQVRANVEASGLLDDAPVPKNTEVVEDDMPAFDEEREAIRRKAARAPKQEPDAVDEAVGAGEAALTFGSAIPAMLGPGALTAAQELVREYAAGTLGDEGAVDRIFDEAGKAMQDWMYIPRTEAGRRDAREAGAFIEEELPPILPVIGPAQGLVGGAMRQAANLSRQAVDKAWKLRKAKGGPVTAAEVAKATDIPEGAANTVADMSNQIHAEEMSRKAVIDLHNNPKTAMSITDDGKGKKRVLTKEEKKVRAEIREAFREDADMADFLKREAEDVIIARREAEAAADLERQFGPDVPNSAMADAMRKAYAKAEQDLPETPKVVDELRVKMIRERQDAILARMENEAEKAKMPQVEAVKNARKEAESAGMSKKPVLEIDERVRRTAQGDIPWTAKVFQKSVKRLEQVSPRLGMAVRKADTLSTKNTNATLGRMMDWFNQPDIAKAMNKNRAFQSALLDADTTRMEAQVPGSGKLFDELVRPELDEINRIRTIHNLPVIDNFFPRAVRDYRALTKRMGKDTKDRLDKAIDAFRAKKHRDPDEEELARIVGTMIGGHPVANYKGRTIRSVGEDIVDLYVNPQASLIDHIAKHNDWLSQQQLFKDTFGIDLRYGESPDATKLGRLLAESHAAGQMKSSDIGEVAKVMSAIYGPGRQSPAPLLMGTKDGITIGTLGFNPSSTLTQLGDATITYSRFGNDMLRREKVPVDAYNTAVRQLAGEMRTQQGISNVTRKSLKSVGFEKVDRVFSEVATNAAYKQRARLARTAPKKLKAELDRLFLPEEADQIIADLRAGRVSDDISSLVNYDVADIRPISRIDMPVHYNQMPNGRVFYSLLSWSLNQMNYVRNTAIKQMSQGQVKAGAKKLAYLTTLFALGGVATGTAKDILFGREIQPLKHAAGAAVPLGLAGKMAAENLYTGRGSVGQAVPAVSILDQLATGIIRFMLDGDPEDLMKALPVTRTWYNIAKRWVSGPKSAFAGNLPNMLDPHARQVLADEEAQRKYPDLPGIKALLPEDGVADTGIRALPSEVTPEQRGALEPSVPKNEAQLPPDDRTRASIQRHEGKGKPGKPGVAYDDSEGYRTVGYGMLLEDPENPGKWMKGAQAQLRKVGANPQKVWNKEEKLNDEQMDKLFEASYKQAQKGAAQLVGNYKQLDPEAQSILTEMVYQMGLPRTKKFVNMRKALRKKDYATASFEMMDSRWAKQTPGRAEELAARMAGI